MKQLIDTMSDWLSPKSESSAHDSCHNIDKQKAFNAFLYLIKRLFEKHTCRFFDSTQHEFKQSTKHALCIHLQQIQHAFQSYLKKFSKHKSIVYHGFIVCDILTLCKHLIGIKQTRTIAFWNAKYSRLRLHTPTHIQCDQNQCYLECDTIELSEHLHIATFPHSTP